MGLKGRETPIPRSRKATIGFSPAQHKNVRDCGRQVDGGHSTKLDKTCPHRRRVAVESSQHENPSTGPWQ
ncbi:hypothetical protein GA0061091_103228 [Gordonia sp. v-85]|nr:hypothetical protein GA0061091_103228 [Gordonia sp. v-85]